MYMAVMNKRKIMYATILAKQLKYNKFCGFFCSPCGPNDIFSTIYGLTEYFNFAIANQLEFPKAISLGP